MADSDSDDGGLPFQRSLPSPLAAPPPGVKPKDWSTFIAIQASLWDSRASSKVAFSGQGKGLTRKKGLKSGSHKVSPSPLDVAAAGPSGRQPKKLVPEDQATRKLKREISKQCFGSSPEETPKKKKKFSRVLSSSEDEEEPVHFHALAPDGKLLFLYIFLLGF